MPLLLTKESVSMFYEKLKIRVMSLDGEKSVSSRSLIMQGGALVLFLLVIVLGYAPRRVIQGGREEELGFILQLRGSLCIDTRFICDLDLLTTLFCSQTMLIRRNISSTDMARLFRRGKITLSIQD